MSPLDGLGLQLRVIRFFEAGIRRLGEGIKTAGICAVVLRNSFGETMIVATSQVDHRPNILAVHDREQFLRSAQVFAIGREFHSFLRLCRAGDVGMEIDEWKFRTLDVRLVHLEHASWLVLRELQGRRLRCVLGRNAGGPAYLHSRPCHQTHSIQPLAPIDHLPPPSIAQDRELAWRCPRLFCCPLTAPCHTLPPNVVM